MPKAPTITTIELGRADGDYFVIAKSDRTLLRAFKAGDKDKAEAFADGFDAGAAWSRRRAPKDGVDPAADENLIAGVQYGEDGYEDES